ncbi:MAG: TIGR02281 family clan AA aspartic protease [Myxococcota bacterium]|nr:TIGR02281 family clan AA aspartic protease [Myxococcota bacterium]
MRLAAFLAALVPIALAVPAAAEIYRWTDEDGRVHFTQSLNEVPRKYRKEAEHNATRTSASRSPVQTYSTKPGTKPAQTKTPPASRAPGAASAGKVHRIRVQRAGTSMYVNVRLNNTVTAPFIIDTGASDVLVPGDVARQLGLDLANARTQRYRTANGVIESPVVMLRSVTLGTAKVENVPASVSDHMSVGLLGLSFFNHFNYNIDAARGIVTLQRNDLAASGVIRGGRSEPQWRAEFRDVRYRLLAARAELETKSASKSRLRERLQAGIDELERQLAALETEADAARVPMAWRQ